MKRNWVAWVVLTLVLLGGSYIRVVDLGQRNFSDDELFQYYVAESLERGEGPRLPSGQEYLRGIDVSRLVQLSVRQFGPTHAAIRLPSTVFGILGLFLFAGILTALGGPWVAAWGSLLLAIHPETLIQSRELRFYTYQMIFGLIALYSGWRALRRAGAPEAPERTVIVRQWLWAGVTIMTLLLAARIQPASLSVAAGWAVCVAFAAAADVLARGWKTWRRSVPVQLVAIGAAGAALALLVVPDLVTEGIARSQTVPRWAIYGGHLNRLDYYYKLEETFPVLLSLLPLVFLTTILRNPRLGLYLAIWFAVPMLLHSLAFPWKGERFVLLAMPPLFAAAAIAAAWGFATLYTLVRRTAARWGLPSRLRNLFASGAVAAVSLGLVITTPAFHQMRKTVRPSTSAGSSEWTRTAEILRSRPDLAQVPIGTAYALHGLFYWDRLDFVVRINGLEQSTSRTPDGKWMVKYNPMGSPEYKTGRPVLTTPEAIRERFGGAGSVLIAFSTGSVEAKNIEPSLYEVLEKEAEELCRGRCGRTKLYHWHFGSRSTPTRSAQVDSAGRQLKSSGGTARGLSSSSGP
jgi:4-amino-4-deoxy-L-arabinose transferase-like glycosyltransferase